MQTQSELLKKEDTFLEKKSLSNKPLSPYKKVSLAEAKANPAYYSVHRIAIESSLHA